MMTGSEFAWEFWFGSGEKTNAIKIKEIKKQKKHFKKIEIGITEKQLLKVTEILASGKRVELNDEEKAELRMWENKYGPFDVNLTTNQIDNAWGKIILGIN